MFIFLFMKIILVYIKHVRIIENYSHDLPVVHAIAGCH